MFLEKLCENLVNWVFEDSMEIDISTLSIVEFSRIFIDSLWLGFLTNLDTKGIERNVNKRALSFISYDVLLGWICNLLLDQMGSFLCYLCSIAKTIWERLDLVESFKIAAPFRLPVRWVKRAAISKILIFWSNSVVFTLSLL